jgi:hypothetical protein
MDPNTVKSQCRIIICIGCLPGDRSPRNWRSSCAIHNRHGSRFVLDRNVRPAELEDMYLVERVEGPEHVVAWFRLFLAAADRSELKVVKEAPELSRCLGVGPDGGDEEIVEFRAVGPIEGV